MKLIIPSIPQHHMCLYFQNFILENSVSVPSVLRKLRNESEDVKSWWLKAVEMYRSAKIADHTASKEARKILSEEIPIYNYYYEDLQWEVDMWNSDAKLRAQQRFESWKEYVRPKHRSRCYKTTKCRMRKQRLAVLEIKFGGMIVFKSGIIGS